MPRAQNKVSKRKSALRLQYGITLEDYDNLLLAQAGVCAICGGQEEGQRLAIDHCHITEKVRGLLCRKCNKGLGLFEDNVERLLSAINYLYHRK